MELLKDSLTRKHFGLRVAMIIFSKNKEIL